MSTPTCARCGTPTARPEDGWCPDCRHPSRIHSWETVARRWEQYARKGDALLVERTGERDALRVEVEHLRAERARLEAELARLRVGTADATVAPSGPSE